jgi:hypothetical protein
VSLLQVQIARMQVQLGTIEDCACNAPVVECGIVATITETVEIPVYTVITVPVTVTVVYTAPVVTSTPDAPSSSTPTPVAEKTPEPAPSTSTPEPEAEKTPAPKATQEKKQKCNQGLGNGSEGCDPGNSNHRNPSNDEGKNPDGSDKKPGNGGRKNKPKKKDK